ncbi:MAG: ASKHA domain-containing protein [Candidatus Omnitrophota bacterium]|nr:ASKHA domain-containing protein [Candidatus Omnitrophota bacterium]
MEKFKVTFHPNNKTIEVEKGTTILSAAISAGVNLNSSCGGDGVCGRCKVILKSGQVLSEPTGRITPEERRKRYLLACLTTIQGNVEVEVPKESTLDLEVVNAKEIFTEAEEIESLPVLREDLFVHSPLSTKLYLELPQPSLDDKISDLERVYRGIRAKQNFASIDTSLANVQHLVQLSRSSEWKITVTLAKKNGGVELVLIEPGDTSKRNYGVAFDIGTTTISGQLIDLNTKQVLGTKATFNKQASFGSDVITRIIFAQKEDGLNKLHYVVIDSLNSMIQELIHEHNIDLNHVTCCYCAGNTTMIQLLLRINPTFIRREPYAPTANFLPIIRAVEAEIKINPHGLLACAPGVSSYVGGDITAGILACGMSESPKLSLLIDIGTNGEIVLGNKDWLISCAASAGPAFEGSGVVSGMRASKGAIQRVSIDKNYDVKFSTIGDAKPQGICGSGYIDALAELLKQGIMDKSGKIKDIKSDKIRNGEFGKEFVLSAKGHNAFDGDVVITEMDIENLKRSKAAIYAATAVLVRHMSLKLEDIKKIFIAGGFGTYLDVEKAIYIGLLPDLPRQKINFIGNSSLVGARQILLSGDALKRVEEIAKKTTYFELSVEAQYMDEYMAALFFPHTDLERFPSVKI